MLPLKNIILERQLLRQLPYTSVRVPLCPKNGVHITTLIENSELWENPQVYIFFKKKKCCFFHISQNMMREIAFLGGNVHKTTIQIAVL